MADEEPVFDPSVMKKKKTKAKKAFDLDAVLSSDASSLTPGTDAGNGANEKENLEPTVEKATEDMALLDLDLESFGKKKKKSKKPVNLEELEKKGD